MIGTKKMLFIRFITLFALFSFQAVSQVTVQTRTDVVVLENKVILSDNDRSLLKSCNFDEYRYMNLRKKIQLVNGPLVELLSIKELQSKGITVSQEVLSAAKERSESFKHESILLLNIGLGITQLQAPK